MELVIEYLKEVNKAYAKFPERKHLFFRGHEHKEKYFLQPSVLRPDPQYNEAEVFLDFKQYAPAHAINYDFTSQKDKLLVDMQHYGIPTRLLDWTVAPLNALFFACLDPLDKDGQVIILNAWTYWRKIIGFKKTHPEIHQIHITARSLFAGGWEFPDIARQIDRQFGYGSLEEDDLKYPFPFVATFTNNRIIHQRGCFTIHGEDRSKMEDFPDMDQYLYRIDLTAANKKQYLKELNTLYINHYSVYPDFEGMSRTIKKNGGLFNIQPLTSS